MSWRVLITSQAMVEVGQVALDQLLAAGFKLTFPDSYRPRGGRELEALLEGHDAVLATVDKFTPEVLASQAASRLKLISRWGVGYDSIDVDAATDQGIAIAYTPGLLDETVADLTFALMLGIARHIAEGDAALKRGTWRPIWGGNVHSKTLGLVGCGRIGQAVAARARGFGMRILAYDISPSPRARDLGVEFVSLDTLLEESDFVSLHAAVTAENRGLIGEAQLRRMKATAYMINAARGALLDEAALARALTEGWIAGAAIDTYAIEPLPPASLLLQCPNILLSPHQASFTRETGLLVSTTAAQAILDLYRGSAPTHALNPSVFSKSNCRSRLS